MAAGHKPAQNCDANPASAPHPGDSMTRRAKIGWLVGVLVLVIAGGGGAVIASRQSKTAQADNKDDRPALEFARADVVTLQPKRLSVELAVPGSVLAVSQATVRSKLSAEVKRVLVREGERVVAGQVVAEFDTAQLRAQLAERTATYESARAQLATTDRTRQANAQLVKQNFISQNAFDTADSAYQAQLAAVAAAKAQLEQTQLLMNDSVVRAPISGIVAKRNVQPGEKLAFDAPLMAIVDLAQLEVQAQVPVSDVSQIRMGMPAQVDIEGIGGRSFAGRVERINPSTEPGTRTVNVYVTLPNEEALLKAGMFARVTMTTMPESEAPSLPMSAVRSDGQQSYVWVIADGKLARRNIATGRRDERAQLSTKFDNLKDGLAAKVVGMPGEAKLADRRTSDATPASSN
jgi:RND family efflux transporter MFP subunit